MQFPAFAHRSRAPFELTRQVTLNGVVKRFEWTNPMKKQKY